MFVFELISVLMAAFVIMLVWPVVFVTGRGFVRLCRGAAEFGVFGIIVFAIFCIALWPVAIVFSLIVGLEEDPA